MSKYIIKGGEKLNGDVLINGAKNAVLPIIASTVLNNGITYLKNVPMLLDTFVALDILKELGCEIITGDNIVFINSKNMNKTAVPQNLATKMRSSIIFLGSILSRFKEASISYPGGCNLGKRPIDFHLNAFREMGITLDEQNEIITATIQNDKDTTINLPFPSVGATQNAVLAGVLSNSTTIIKNSAKEPEIIDMMNFLKQMGADITGEGTSVITVKGVASLNKFVEYTIMPDRIEAGTFLCMAGATKGNITIKNVCPNHIKALTDILLKTGCDIGIKKSEVSIKAPQQLEGIGFLETLPYPNFPTDMQAQIISMLTISRGTSIIKENIFEARNKHIYELNKMGADITENNNTFIVKGVPSLVPFNVVAKDLRGGASLICSAIATNGQSIVDGAMYVRRGYENIELKLQQLGANIKYIED